MNSRGINQLINLARRLPPKYWIVIAILAGGYYFAEPTLERMLGRRLPGFNDNQAAELAEANNQKPNVGGADRQQLDDLFEQTRRDAKNSSSGSNTDAKLDPRDAFKPTNSGSGSKSGSASQSNKTTPSKSKQKPKPKLATNSNQSNSNQSSAGELGQLTETGRNVFTSTAGLVFTPGSYEGHRLKHILRHCEDQPDRRGSHGVFDGGKDGMLAVLDEAYLKGKKGGRGVKKENQDGKTIYTVDLGRRIGYVGGSTGKRRNRPPVNKVKIVLVGEKVITAYPVER